ncbi:RNA polymerase sigma factor SigF [Microcoleus sp. FACHB-1515]|uniref:RNA polymerase sigma factor SigF n=1 Tax=Cyanophyceae TaxID=3028117 RepID=UPI0016859B2F|nr:RNA polymerase sigma factor SigF [Microcoleus sp. FACHB-1515]MBD2093157.1 RNA polymerase sigma factor SigF [Microcoleus sp. FACHB-1515]
MTAIPSPRYSAMALLVGYHQNPSIAVRNQIVQINTGLVRKIAHRLSHQCSEPYEDLEQIGYLGLIRAIERFDPSHGCAFSSFAVPYIRGEILHYLRDRSGTVKIPRRWQELQKQGQRVREKLTKSLGRQPNDREIAEALNISVSEWQDIRLSSQNRSLLSLDATISHQADSPLTLGDTLPDLHMQTMQSWEEDRHQLQAAMSQLEEKTRDAIEYVYYRDMSRKEVSECIGVSPMTVTRRIQRGIQQMVTTLQPLEAAEAN